MVDIEQNAEIPMKSIDIRYRGEHQPLDQVNQLLENEEEDSLERPKQGRISNNAESIPTIIGLPIFLIVFGIYGLVYLVQTSLPYPLTIQDGNNTPERFIAERAELHLFELEALGPKICGSHASDVQAVNYITKEIQKCAQNANSAQEIEHELQITTGSFSLFMLPYGFSTYYSGVPNILVRLRGSKHENPVALLLNCHFDSVPTSPGGSDDGLNCAVMLEVLRILSQSSSRLLHDVIFLFNGAEENVLQASHGFITKHKWAKQVKAFINLEACGAGGQEILFQTGPKHPWLVEAYARAAPHPHGFVIAEEIFQSGLIPSDTDFRIFRDFGHIPGLDFAHFRNGYVYHTKYDNKFQIPRGTFQHTGDNVLALVQEIASSGDLNAVHDHSGDEVVFFDFLGLFLVHYSRMTGVVFNVLVVILSSYSVVGTILQLGSGVRHAELVRELCVAIVGPACGWFLAFAWTLGVALVLDWTNSTMAWYSNPLMIAPLYFVSAFLMTALGPVIQIHLIKQSTLNMGVRVRLYCLGIQLLWTVFLLAATLIGLRSAYLFLTPVLFPAVVNVFVLWITHAQNSLRLWTWSHTCSMLPIVVFIFEHALVLSLFIPLTARSGTHKNPEIIVSILSTGLSLLATSYLAPKILLFRRPQIVLLSLAAVHILTLMAVFVTPLSFRYSISEPTGIHPQRYYVQHVHREIYKEGNQLVNSDSGFWILGVDRNSPSVVQEYIPNAGEAVKVDRLCDSELFCSLPLQTPRLSDSFRDSLWLPGPSPVIEQPNSVELVGVRKGDHITTLSFTIKGPDHMTLMFSPLPGIEVVDWNLEAQLISSKKFENRSTYFIVYGRGIERTPWNFSLNLQVPESYSDSDKMVDLSLAAHYYHSERRTAAFEELLSYFPSWSHVAPWVSTFKSWKF